MQRNADTDRSFPLPLFVMGKPVNKVSRKLSKKMSRVTGGTAEDDTQAQPAASSSGVPAQAVPTDIPNEVHLQTRREQLLKKIFAKKSNDKDGGVKKKRSERESTIVSKKDEDVRIPKSVKKTKKDLEAVGRQALAKAQKEPEHMQLKTSLNMKSAARHDLFVKELNLFQHVSQMPHFVEDPFAAIQQHLDSTMKKLVPQTADVGRRPAGQAPPFNPRQRHHNSFSRR